jgi:hypothetical protein
MCPRDIGVIVNNEVKEQELKTEQENDNENQGTYNTTEKNWKNKSYLFLQEPISYFPKERNH